MSPAGQPHAPPTGQAAVPRTANAGWTVEKRDGTGLFIVSQQHKTLLFRFDPTAQVLYCWDKKAQREVPIRLAQLTQLQGLQVAGVLT